MIERTGKPIVERSRPTVNFFQYTSFGSGSKIFTCQSVKILAPFSQDLQTTIRAFPVRIFETADQLTLAYRLEHAGRISLGSKKRSTWMIVKIAKENRKNDYLRYPNSLTF
nr:hypothetical protein [Porphyromonas gulae]